jgi:hypothetical protein
MSESNEPKFIAPVEQARIVLRLLKEYTRKLSILNSNLLEALSDFARCTIQSMAWLLDQGELLRNPLSQLISRGSSLLEHTILDSVTKDELTLRMREIEIHMHHTVRLTYELRQAAEKKKMGASIAKLRVSAGLNAMKGGPLRPE